METEQRFFERFVYTYKKVRGTYVRPSHLVVWKFSGLPIFLCMVFWVGINCSWWYPNPLRLICWRCSINWRSFSHNSSTAAKGLSVASRDLQGQHESFPRKVSLLKIWNYHYESQSQWTFFLLENCGCQWFALIQLCKGSGNWSLPVHFCFKETYVYRVHQESDVTSSNVLCVSVLLRHPVLKIESFFGNPI